MIPCPPWEQLEQLLAEALGDAERVPLETHVESCALCQERLQQLGGAGEPLSLSHASGVDPMPALKVAQLTDRSPAFLERMKQSPPARRSRRAPRQDDGAALPEVPGYEILGVLGHGATGVVYKARQVQLNRLVALKMILGPEHSRPEDRIRFQIEGEVVARLHHPNIVQIYEVGSHAGRPFFAFEFVDGGSLAERLDGTPQPPCQAAELVETLARAVHAAHLQGIVHRDLKPSNILLATVQDPEGSTSHGRPGTPYGIPMIADFGLAKQLHSDVRMTQSGFVLGTPRYMAPEQCQGESRDIGPATDVYALGTMLYELLTGRTPFQAPDTIQLLRRVVDEEPAAPRRQRPGLPRDLECICLKCLEKEPRKRYPSALDLADDLGRFVNDEPIRARPVSSLERLERWCRRNPALAGLTASVLLLVVLVGVAVTVGYVQTTLALGREAEQRVEAQRQEGIARTAEEKARQEAARTRYILYITNLQLAAQIWSSDDGTARAVRDLLAVHLPREGEEDLRDFPWRYQWQLLNHSAVTLRGHHSALVQGAFDPDGQLITVDHDRQLRRWNPVTRQATHHVDGAAAGPAGPFALAPDGTTVAVGRADGTVRLLDTTTGQERRVLRVPAGGPTALQFLPDSKTLVVRAKDGTAKVWDVTTGQEEETRQPIPPEFSSRLHPLNPITAVSPDGRTLALSTAYVRSQVALLEWRTARPRGTFPKHVTSVDALAWSPDGQLLASGDREGQVILWEAVTLQENGTRLHPHASSVNALAFSPDGNRLATGGRDGLVTVWEIATRQRLFRLKGHSAAVAFVAFSPDGKSLASGSADGTARLWDLTASGEARLLVKRGTAEFNGLAYSPDGQWLTTAGGPAAQLWQTRTGQLRHDLQGHTKVQVDQQTTRTRVTAVAVSPDGQTLATGGNDSLVKLWDATTGQERVTLVGRPSDPPQLPGQVVGSLAFSPDGTILVAGFGSPNVRSTREYDQVVKVWEVASARPIRTLRGHRNTVSGVAFSPDGTLLATASLDRSVKLWQVGTWQGVGTLSRPDLFLSVAFSPEGKALATGASFGIIRLWDTATWHERHTLRGHADHVNGLAFSLDSRTLASASNDRTVRLWDVASGREMRILRGHTGFVRCVAFSPDGNALASASWDRTVRLWEAASPEAIAGASAEDQALGEQDAATSPPR